MTSQKDMLKEVLAHAASGGLNIWIVALNKERAQLLFDEMVRLMQVQMREYKARASSLSIDMGNASKINFKYMSAGTFSLRGFAVHKVYYECPLDLFVTLMTQTRGTIDVFGGTGDFL